MSKKSCDAAGSIEDALFANGAVNCIESTRRKRRK